MAGNYIHPSDTRQIVQFKKEQQKDEVTSKLQQR